MYDVDAAHALPDDHERSVTAYLEALVDAESDLALAVAVADQYVRVDEELTVLSTDGPSSSPKC